MIDFNSLILERWIEPIPDFIPDVTPVSFRDIDMNPPMNMEIPCADPCPACGAFNMRVGDYVTFGVCAICLEPPLY